jgi:hypothetical protein
MECDSGFSMTLFNADTKGKENRKTGKGKNDVTR